METQKTRLPKGFKFEEGKSYSLKFRRTEYRYTYLSDSDMYKLERFSVGKTQHTSYVINKDVPNSMDYTLSFADGKGVINEFIPADETKE